MRAAADNDILLKGACYRLLPTLMATVSGDGVIGVLGASKFVVPKKIKRNRLRGDPAAAEAHFAAFLAENEIVEPSQDEQKMAGILEAAAQKMALNLDVGESQLVAILVSRCLPWLLTGDKRAIESVERLLDTNPRLAGIMGKIKCLEQLVAELLTNEDPTAIRPLICAEPYVDKTLTICFSCTSIEVDSAGAFEGLTSYIADLRTRAVRVLAT